MEEKTNKQTTTLKKYEDQKKDIVHEGLKWGFEDGWQRSDVNGMESEIVTNEARLIQIMKKWTHPAQYMTRILKQKGQQKKQASKQTNDFVLYYV